MRPDTRLSEGKKRVVVAMSGGVDSSTVAGLLVEQGHEVIGVTMKLYDRSDEPDADTEGEGTCCSLDDVADARRVANHLGIPFYVGNYERVFTKAVMDRFVDSYVAGRTPNPCVQCNDVVKFRPLLARARALGADYLATGHYARTRIDAEGRVALFVGVDARKDQTYFLAGIRASALERVVFPLGELDKDEVRHHADRLGLPVANKPESQEICFIPDNDYKGFVERQAGERVPGPGAIVSLDGMRLGRHQGIHRFTIGQRRGLGVASGEPLYVVGLSAEEGTVTVGGRQDVLAAGLWAADERWISGERPADGARVMAKIRHNHGATAATIRHGRQGRLEVHFDAPVLAVAPGQQLVCYAGDRVLGAATIEGPLRGRGGEAQAHG